MANTRRSVLVRIRAGFLAASRSFVKQLELALLGYQLVSTIRVQIWFR